MSTYYILTGAAGFVGSNLLRALNDRGITNIIAVDNLERGDKFRNLIAADFDEFIDKREFLERLDAGEFDNAVEAVLHQGACSDTTERDGRYMMANNYSYSLRLLDFCMNESIPLVYASSAAVYGAGTTFSEDRVNESPLNVYGYSKFLFDQVVRRRFDEASSQIVGLRYFNVYGRNEAHKGRMASVVCHFFEQYRRDGKVRLFEGSGNYGNGEQRRDFISVEDVVKVNLYFLENPSLGGLYNVGTGQAGTFNDVARATINACRHARGEPMLTLDALRAQGAIEYIPFPADLVGKYQSFTQADTRRLLDAGYDEAFLDVETGVGRYVGQLLSGEG